MGADAVASYEVVSQAGRRSPQGDLLPTTVPMQVDVRDHRIVVHEGLTNVEEDHGGQRERGPLGTAPHELEGSREESSAFDVNGAKREPRIAALWIALSRALHEHPGFG